jgi:hypothetical protein
MLAWRELEFAEAARPPVEACSEADQVTALLERDAARGLGLLQVFEGREMLVGLRGVGQGQRCSARRR